MFFAKLAVATALLTCALAGPVALADPVALPDPVAHAGTIVKRAEGVHLVNCVKNGAGVYSEVIVRSSSFNFSYVMKVTRQNSSVSTMAIATSIPVPATSVSYPHLVV
jgi:hypothetical protein